MGGTEVTIKGQGFPMDVETKEFFKLRIDG